MNLRPVILAGGSGKRLWPLSRNQYPKPFLTNNSQTSLIQNTVQRSLNLELALPVIVCNEQNRFLLTDHLNSISAQVEKILLEPLPKNTAPALTLAALYLLRNLEDPILFSMPSDHFIEEDEDFFEVVGTASKLAEDGGIVTFGIDVETPDINFGYIQKGKPTKSAYFELKGFHEKPDSLTAKKMHESKDFLWNSGMFLIKASSWIHNMKIHSPRILEACERSIQNGTEDGIFFRPAPEPLDDCPSKSIDHAVMENLKNSENVFKNWVVPLKSRWSDLGSWSSFMSSQIPDKSNNLLKGDVITDSVQNSIIVSDHRTVAASHVESLIIVETPDAILVADRNQEHKIKDLVNKIPVKSTAIFESHKKVFRPWGHYEILDTGKEFQVKRLTVLPEHALSLQIHNRRTEHWVVVSGVATVTRGSETMTLEKNQSTYIPKGVQHRLENNKGENLEIIEVQSGSYFGEDDIVRLDDRYDRASGKSPL
ncbi:MAG: mannose-1-phosphate guanylyltransferase/mannose-6-phosphate isomerase [Chloroflexota bacterium]|nr:mannose-1-phosphate guanylyltransferase/mannose-6-phosphate isomerase [Chloroflexota bacterium]HBR64811.1 mannose-1-phosphate guanylyltransferase/mannose-6-phosphate isomerase [Dehalococcoidia bacterium]